VLGTEFISASRWACLISLLSFWSADCIMAAWDSEPSGFWSGIINSNKVASWQAVPPKTQGFWVQQCLLSH